MGASLSKTVGTRLRTIHTDDHALLQDLNLFAGYIIARGYNEASVKYHLANMANRPRMTLLKGQFHSERGMVIPLVSKLHPATTVLTQLTKKYFQEACDQDSSLEFIIPKSSLIVAYTKLPNLQVLLCKNDQNSLVDFIPNQRSSGYTDIGCRCNVCKASIFNAYVRPPSMPGYSVRIPSQTSCRSGPAIVYHITCMSGLPQCKQAHYVGRAYTSDATKSAMGLRWSNHKYHFRIGHNKCKFTNHLLQFHKGEDPQLFCKIQILCEASSENEVKLLELEWTRRLFAFQPTGLNVREEKFENLSTTI